MSRFLSLVVLLIASHVQASECNWDKPGHNPFTGGLAQAVDHYPDIPPSIRMALQTKMTAGQLDDVVEIRRDSISSKQGQYSPEITHMHFGRNKVCNTVSRTGWTADHVEKAKVFCDSGYCLLVPRICNNLSQVRRIEPAPAEVIDNGGVGSVTGPGDAPTVEMGFAPGEVYSVAPEPFYAFFPAMPCPVIGAHSYQPPPAPVAPVPEPGEWAMMLAGLTAIIWKARSA